MKEYDLSSGCPDGELLKLYLAGKLTDNEIEYVAGHLDTCPICVATVASLYTSQDTIGGYLNQSNPAILRDTAYGRVAEEFHSRSISIFRKPPFSIRQYRALKISGFGGMGVVYKAKDEELGRIVAIKFLKSQIIDPGTRKRFRQEVLALAKLQHQNIVRLYDADDSEFGPYMVLEFVDGGCLEGNGNVLELPLAELLEIFRQVVDAVAYCHEMGVFHRDIKPSNVLMTSTSRPMLTDFGIAKTVGENPLYTYKSTLTGEVIGTPAYMPPELAKAEHEKVNCTTDVYSLGGLLFYLLYKRPPHEGTNLAEILDRIQNRDVVPPNVAQRTVPSALVAICLRCLQRNQRDRYASAIQLADDIQKVIQGQQPVALLLRQARRRRELIARFLGLSTAILLVGSAWHFFRTSKQRFQVSLEKKLNFGEKVTLHASNWSRLVLDQRDTKLETVDDGKAVKLYSTRSAGCLLVESVDVERLSISAEIRHDQGGVADSGVGFMFFFKEMKGTSNGGNVSAVVIRFNDLRHAGTPPFEGIVPEKNLPKGNRVTILQYRARVTDGVIDETDFREEKRHGKTMGFKPKPKDDLFRKFVFEVDQSTLRSLKVVWQPQVITERREHSYQLQNLEIPLSKENLGFGLFVYNGTATYRNITIKKR